MLALNIFKDDVREALQQASPVYWLAAEPLGICPYLTFELRSAEKSGKDSDATCQISAVSVLWLSQWVRLKHELGLSDFADLRRYSIVVNSMDFQIYVTEFNGSIYSVTQIDDGSFYRPEGVKQYAKWSNAIHKWGLGTNARAFEKDIETLWEKAKNDLGSRPTPLTRGALQALPQQSANVT